MKKKRYLLICIGLLGIIAFLHFTGGKPPERIQKEKVLLMINTTSLAPYDYNISKGYIGTLYPARKFELHSKVGGRILKMNYDIGDRVSNGDTIAQIDDTIYQLEYRQELGKLNIEQSKVRQKEMSIELAKKEYERTLALREEKVISLSVLEKAEFDLAQKRMTFEVDKASLKMQETAVEMSKLKWSYTDINARWAREEDDGTRILAERFIDQGAMITPNTVIATIIDIGTLTAEIFVGEKEYPGFKKGMSVTIEVDSFPGVVFTGWVKRVAPFINELTRQAKVQISVDNADLRLRPGMFARTEVVLNRRTAVQMLPKTCIVEDEGIRGVYLYDGETETVAFMPVKVGSVRHGKVEILNAAELDKPVVKVGQHMVKDGDRVKHMCEGKGEFSHVESSLKTVEKGS